MDKGVLAPPRRAGQAVVCAYRQRISALSILLRRTNPGSQELAP